MRQFPSDSIHARYKNGKRQGRGQAVRLWWQAQTGLQLHGIPGKITTSVTHQSSPTGCNCCCVKPSQAEERFTNSHNKIDEVNTQEVVLGFFFFCLLVMESGGESITQWLQKGIYMHHPFLVYFNHKLWQYVQWDAQCFDFCYSMVIKGKKRTLKC